MQATGVSVCGVVCMVVASRAARRCVCVVGHITHVTLSSCADPTGPKLLPSISTRWPPRVITSSAPGP